MQVSYEKGQKIKNIQFLAELIHSLLVGEVYKIVYHPKQFKLQQREDLIMQHVQTLIEDNFS